MTTRAKKDARRKQGVPERRAGWNGETGIRVRIAEVVSPLRQPHPEHESKPGTITGTRRIGTLDGEPWMTPVITLDDGTILHGSECWWEPIKEGN